MGEGEGEGLGEGEGEGEGLGEGEGAAHLGWVERPMHLSLAAPALPGEG